MEDLLLLVHRMPYPPNKGDKIRSWHLLKHLAQRYRVHLATFVDDPDDWQHVAAVQALCASSHFAALSPRAARVRSLGAVLRNRSLSYDYYRDAGLQGWVNQAMQQHGIDRIVVFSSPMAQYAEAWPQARRVIDFCDVDSDKWRQYAGRKPWPASALFGYEASRLLRYERRIAAAFDAALFVSAPEAELFRTLAPESAARTGWFSNGVDTSYFAPGELANPYAPGDKALVFCGAMDYWPNVDAVQWFAAEVLPALRARDPAVRFVIVGARPAAEVQALAAQPGITVTGTVPDVRPYVAHATLSVAPLRIARGIQNKVLEAMAMAKAVLVTPQALEGIDAGSGRELLLADGPQQWIAAAGAALAGPPAALASLGQAARARVLAAYSWDARLAPLDHMIETPVAQPAGAAPALWNPA
ncbi:MULTISPECIES: TIGR03087 family PEP-CTERM/XrtA system glycosyltransferase [unclassified Duganella]|uniref:TIGR03087 family PEP-CTERM/XrtA system glycosyltransferase n=1 Tax=unclassified Duganella TaxID=2636909 RepID=UPI0006F3969D|nr:MULTISPECIES: TIGR03087 family PEP-CTERM/XrtA system glycosyltransferase [unclassified Duganella]KQV59007.1 sugar transferase [Duganella sp. Root336D2]KRC02497.1 sugar transferase [Duganella sp. Root198D2]